MANWFDNLLNWGWNPQTHAVDEMRQVRTVAMAGLIIMLVVIPFFVRAYLWDIQIRLVTLPTVFLLSAMALWVLRKHQHVRSMRVSAHILCFAVLVGAMGGTLTGGGVGAVHQSWLLLIPLLAAITLGIRMAVMWAVLGLVSLGLLAVCELYGWIVPTQMPDMLQRNEGIFQFVAMFVGLLSMISVFISQQDQSRAVIAERNQQLQQQMAERERAEHEAYLAQQAKTRFLADMGHQVRTPLNAILGFSQRLEKSLADRISERERGAFVHLSDNAAYLLALVEDVFDLAAIDSGTLTLTPGMVDLAQLLESVQRQGEIWAKPSNLSLFLQSCPRQMVRADARRLHQAVANVIRHSLRRVQTGGVTLTAALNDTHLQIDMTDTAPPLTQEQRDHLFDRDADLMAPADREAISTELGLVVAKALVELQGGTLQCVAAAEGNHYRLTLPLQGDA